MKLINPNVIIDKVTNYTVEYAKKKAYDTFGFETFIATSNIPIKEFDKIWTFLCSLDTSLVEANPMRSKINNGIAYDKNNNLNRITMITKNTGMVIKSGLECRKFLRKGFEKEENYTGNEFDLYVYFFGKNSYRLYKKLNYIIKNSFKDSKRIFNYNISACPPSGSDREDIRVVLTKNEPRFKDTIFFDDSTYNVITKHIDAWLQNEKKYHDKGLTFKTGILLYGKPGTGKSSLLKILCSEYDWEMVTIDMTTFDKLDVNALTSMINNSDGKFIVALEDIDCILLDRDGEFGNKADKDDKKVINKLLQFLDSNSSPTDVVFIATTNHLELLDEAILREGRFDLKLEVKGIEHKETAAKMIKSFGVDNIKIKEIIDSIDTWPVSQSKLQAITLQKAGL